jgi:predicted RNA-binding Zn ribbon-like protein
LQVALDDYVWGAAVATDLVNTAPTVMLSTGEALPTPAALTDFLGAHAVRLDALDRRRLPRPADVAAVHALRQEVRDVLDAETEDDVVAAASVLVRRAAVGPGVHRDDGDRWQWHVQTAPGASVAAELAVLVGVSLLGVLRTLSHDRFRRCASPTCTGVFVDTSRAGRRRYCMPDRCGNRVNVANYRARRRTGGAET